MKKLTGQDGSRKEQRTYKNLFFFLIIKAHVAQKK